MKQHERHSFVSFIPVVVKRESMISSSSNVKNQRNHQFIHSLLHSNFTIISSRSAIFHSFIELLCIFHVNCCFLFPDDVKGKYSIFMFSSIVQRFFTECDAISSRWEITFMTVECITFSLSTANGHRDEATRD